MILPILALIHPTTRTRPHSRAHTVWLSSNDQPDADWPQMRSRLAADKIAVRRHRTSSSRDHMDGHVPGGRSENITPASQG
jgi:hypothetical protein